MKFKDVLKSPVFPAGHRWNFAKRKKAYESDVTALVRTARLRTTIRLSW